MFSTLPLNALRTFEAAARLGSFKAAAEELSVTPAAVSHQVRGLETRLGAMLFKRFGQGVVVTEEGELLYRQTHRALLDIHGSLKAFYPDTAPQVLTISTTPGLAAAWLIPRLGRFYRRFPQFNVRVDTRNDLVDILRDSSIDLAIRSVSCDDPKLFCQELMNEQFSVYGAPGLVESLDVNQVELINLHWKIPGAFSINWESWCAAAGCQAWIEAARMREFDDEHFALGAAIAGQGLVLASNVLVADSLRRGELVAYRPEVTLHGPRYVAVCVPGRERQVNVSAFLMWLTTAVLQDQ
ncbi:LysR substrate-binding domain-containing protein [Pseudomonas sp. CBSPBW29]|uniref:LysR substrate-binding domain-containing protein n=1 Tax=Pseudomonas sp. CBS TaxID=2971912 RepID=UPI0021AC3CB7|nr:LysR substrate-binding domain-containing protein [Pseudomonas sp. CBS]WEL45665.1 LysR substrate-binding domain-containing protein [Pseudomonas sp. CBSPBW29]WEL67934.1 LysR substrate-binding domain-containing protein [Pseudomonas sp. CBSPGW29]WEL73794.1 LysR substrate-binding domain-containing protein [Pseudomonas sp. CBSPCGW29]WEL79667.1 LysR substrate-binding domain-containing protein [Pseudomonas sp. CBSPAW29]WEL85582.1 LysR substrate-binding domain-containing protein [Pseudomonas sp. CBS